MQAAARLPGWPGNLGSWLAPGGAGEAACRRDPRPHRRPGGGVQHLATAPRPGLRHRPGGEHGCGCAPDSLPEALLDPDGTDEDPGTVSAFCALVDLSGAPVDLDTL